MHINFNYILVSILIYFGCHWILHRNKDTVLSLLINNKSKLKVIFTSIIASTLFLTPIAPIIEHGQIIGFSQKTAEAASLADVDILARKELDAQLGNNDGPGDYTLDLKLEGIGLANVELVNPETTAVFYAPRLAGDLGEQATAEVRIEISPVTMDDLPALSGILSDLTNTLVQAVSEIVKLLDEIVTELSESPVGYLASLEVNGLEELQTSINSLTNLKGAVTDLLVYQETFQMNVENERGIIQINFSTGVEQHLDSAVDKVVLQLLNDIVDAANSLEIELSVLEDVPILGDLLEALLDGLVNGPVNAILGLVTGTILPPVETLIVEVADGTVDLTGDLLAIQLIGRTNISVSTTINRTTNVSGTIPIDGGVVDTNVVDLDILSISDSSTAIVLPDTTPPDAPTLYDVYESDRVVRGNGEANATVRIVASNFEMSGEVDESGEFAVDIPDDIQSLEPNTTITVYLVDDAGNESDPTETTVIEEEFYLRVPDRLMFEPTSIDKSTTLIPRQEPNWMIEMIDTRRPGSYFQITAQIEEPLTSASGTHQLPNALIYVNEGGESHPLTNEPTMIIEGESTNNRITEINWTEDQGPLVEVDTSNVFATDYSTTIIWTLADVPSGE